MRTPFGYIRILCIIEREVEIGVVEKLSIFFSRDYLVQINRLIEFAKCINEIGTLAQYLLALGALSAALICIFPVFIPSDLSCSIM